MKKNTKTQKNQFNQNPSYITYPSDNGFFITSTLNIKNKNQHTSLNNFNHINYSDYNISYGNNDYNNNYSNNKFNNFNLNNRQNNNLNYNFNKTIDNNIALNPLKAFKAKIIYIAAIIIAIPAIGFIAFLPHIIIKLIKKKIASPRI